MIHQVDLNDSITNNYALNSYCKYGINQLKRRPEDITLNSRMEDLLDIKMYHISLLDSFSLSNQTILLFELYSLIPFKVQFYVL